MNDNILFEISQMRKTLKPHGFRSDPAFYSNLADRLQNTRYLIKENIVQLFIEDMRLFEKTKQLTNTKKHINNKNDYNIFSLFDASYFPSLNLDFLNYTPLEIDHELTGKFPSGATPVNINYRSEGFDSRVVVALFPENHIDHLQKSDDIIFYFIDKFVDRYKRITKKLLDNIVYLSDFSILRSADEEEIEKAAVRWVHLHEYFHRQGPMPIPNYLYIKSIKPLAGLEELRVDISGIMTCLRNGELASRKAELTFQFVLAERLLRYAVEGIPKPNYDAVASQMLFNYLLENKGIYLKRGLIHIGKDLVNALACFVQKINSIESLINNETPLYVQTKLLEFVNQYTSYDLALGDYRHIEYFSDVKQRLNV